MPPPNDIDIFTEQSKTSEQLLAYQNNKGANLHFLSEVSGKPIKRKEGSLYSIDLIIKLKPSYESIEITIPHNGVEKIFKIVHPQELMTKLYPVKSNSSGYNSNSNINEAPINNIAKNKKTKKAKKKTEYNIKSKVLKAINGYGLIPVLEKQADKRKRNSGNEGKPSFRSRLNFGSSPSKKGRLNFGSSSPSKKGRLNFGSSSPSKKGRFSFGSNSS